MLSCRQLGWQGVKQRHVGQKCQCPLQQWLKYGISSRLHIVWHGRARSMTWQRQAKRTHSTDCQNIATIQAYEEKNGPCFRLGSFSFLCSGVAWFLMRPISRCLRVTSRNGDPKVFFPSFSESHVARRGAALTGSLWAPQTAVPWVSERLWAR